MIHNWKREALLEDNPKAKTFFHKRNNHDREI